MPEPTKYTSPLGDGSATTFKTSLLLVPPTWLKVGELLSIFLLTQRPSPSIRLPSNLEQPVEIYK